jgi:hypothetical protein
MLQSNKIKAIIWNSKWKFPVIIIGDEINGKILTLMSFDNVVIFQLNVLLFQDLLELSK